MGQQTNFDQKKQPFFQNYAPQLFYPAAIVYILILLLALIMPDKLGSSLVDIRDFILKNINWVIMLAGSFSIVFCIWLVFSRYGDVKLGGKDAKPEFSFYTWIAILFCTGLGTGFVIFGSAEPVIHLFKAATVIDEGIAGTAAGVPEALRISVLCWGLFAWSLYAVGGIAIGYPAYNHNKPFRTSTGLYGLLGERCNDTIGSKILDVIAIIATIGGVSMMLGLSVASISFAMNILFGITLSATAKVLLMALFIFGYIISSTTGLARGIRYLSESAGYIAFILLFGVLILSPTPFNYIMATMIDTTGEFLWKLPKSIFWMDSAYANERSWAHDWYVFNILWSISYVAFTGGLVARISKGRTLRQIATGVSLVPTLLCLIWFTVWGTNSMFMQLTGLADVFSFVQSNPEQALYQVLQSFPYGVVLCYVAFVCFILFALTTADSASYFIAQQTSTGHNKPALTNCIFWGLIIGMTGVLFQIIGGYHSIKALAIVMGSPFVIVIFLYMYSLVKMLSKDYPKQNIMLQK